MKELLVLVKNIVIFLIIGNSVVHSAESMVDRIVATNSLKASKESIQLLTETGYPDIQPSSGGLKWTIKVPSSKTKPELTGILDLHKKRDEFNKVFPPKFKDRFKAAIFELNGSRESFQKLFDIMYRYIEDENFFPLTLPEYLYQSVIFYGFTLHLVKSKAENSQIEKNPSQNSPRGSSYVNCKYNDTLLSFNFIGVPAVEALKKILDDIKSECIEQAPTNVLIGVSFRQSGFGISCLYNTTDISKAMDFERRI